MAKPKAKSNEAALAELIIDKIKEQVGTLAAREWPDIGRILANDEEIDLSFKVNIVDRKASAGEVAEKDNRIRCVISFSEKYTANIDAPIPDPNQTSLPLDEAAEPEIE